MNELDIFVQIQKEISVDENGIGSASKRGLARMCGVSHNNWSNKGGNLKPTKIATSLSARGFKGGNLFTHEVDEYLEGKGFDNVDKIFTEEGKIIDQVCGQVIKFYSKKNDIADRFLDAYLTIG